MKKTSEQHPEVTNTQNICDIVPNSPDAEEICRKVNKHKDSKNQIKTNPRPKKG